MIRYPSDIPIFHHIYSLYKTIHHHQTTIPKAVRYTLWLKCETTTLDLLEATISTGYKRGEDRLKVLHVMSMKLDMLKVFIRLAKETNALNHKHAILIQSQVHDIGKMLGGWIRAVSPND